MSASNTIQAIPIPNKLLITMSSSISGVNNNSITGYQPNGIYEIKTSSYYNDTTQGFNAFNDNIQTYWECDNMNNPNYQPGRTTYPQYTQKTYGGEVPSSYLGGGAENNKNKWITKVGPNTNKTDLVGEWIQIKIPYKLYLTSYSITTPTFSGYNTFPVKFTLVGSIDGEIWDYIDQRLMNKNELPNGNMPVKTFSVMTYNKYSHFRLIVNTMSDFVDRLRISTIKLLGTTILDDVPDRDTFTTLHRSIDTYTNTYNKGCNKSLDSADFYRPTYSMYGDMYNTSNHTESDEIYRTNNTSIDENRITMLSQDLLLYTSVFTGVLIFGLLLSNAVKK
jgi:hypothetical protein